MAKDTKISNGDLSYICARNRQQAYNLVISVMKSSGLTQAELARRIGMRTDSMSRLLKMPQNWELNTFSKLYYGICGATLKFAPDYPHTAASSHSTTGTLPTHQDPSSHLRVIKSEDERTFSKNMNLEAASN